MWDWRVQIDFAVAFMLLLVSGLMHTRAHAQVEEYKVHEIPLPEAWQDRSFEYSSLTWFGDRLLLLPQYPARTGYRIPVIDRAELIRFTEGQMSAPVAVETLRLDTSLLEKRLVGYEGLEGIAFYGRHAFLTIETEIGDRPLGYVVRAKVEGEVIRIEAETLKPLFTQTQVGNFAYEAIVVDDTGVHVLYELNGGPNAHPRVLSFDRELQWLGTPPIEHLIEYRITDASSTLDDGSFFVMNYHWSGDDYVSNPCLLTKAFGRGETHARSLAVERIVRMRPSRAGYAADQEAPLQLRLQSGDSRNWEGLEYLEGVGILLITDEHPRTILGLIPLPDAWAGAQLLSR